MHRSGVPAWLLLVAATLAAGCIARVAEPPPPLEPDATFAAHRVHGGLTIDRQPGGGTGMIAARGFSFDAPAFTVRIDDVPRAALWYTAPAAVVVTAIPDRGATPAARVQPSWDDGAVELAYRAADGRGVHGGPFARIGYGSGLTVISRIARTNLDVEGSYRAPLRDAAGAEVGWLEVQTSARDGTRIYQAAIPADLPFAGPALAVALDGELDWIDWHTIDVYRGTGGRGVERGDGIR